MVPALHDAAQEDVTLVAQPLLRAPQGEVERSSSGTSWQQTLPNSRRCRYAQIPSTGLRSGAEAGRCSSWRRLAAPRARKSLMGWPR
jgi:hypothetical protein